jgi:hypothetical protein
VHTQTLHLGHLLLLKQQNICFLFDLQALGVRVAQPMDVMQLALLPALALHDALSWPTERLVAYLAFPLLAGLLTHQLPAGIANSAASASGVTAAAAATPAAVAATPVTAAGLPFSATAAATPMASVAGSRKLPKSHSRTVQQQQLQQQQLQQQAAWLMSQLAEHAVVVTTLGNVRISNSSSIAGHPAGEGAAIMQDILYVAATLDACWRVLTACVVVALLSFFHCNA